MKLHKQLIAHDPANGQFGDCFRTVLACFLDKESPEEVPNFAELMYSDTKNPDSWIPVMQSFLANFGFTLVSHAFSDSIENLLASQENTNPGAYYILVGSSLTGVNHCLIAKGDKIIHDPHPNNVGIIGPCDDGFFWVEYLVPLFGV